MTIDIADLNAKFGIKGVAEVMAGNGGLPAVRVSTPVAAGTMYLHGAHVTSWAPAGFQDVLWVSKKSWFENGRPIRGGVPICYPWFSAKEGDSTAPGHGFVRLSDWELESITEKAGEVTVVMAFQHGPEANAAKWWTDAFVARHRVTFGRELLMKLETANPGNKSITVQEAQHTYFAVGDVRKVRVKGLSNVDYTCRIPGDPMTPHAGDLEVTMETDRCYMNTTTPVVLEDPSKGRRITVNKENSRCTVVWNPWVAKAKAMPDFSDEEWPEMICIETCNVAELAAKVLAGQNHTMATRIQVSPM